MCPFLLVPAGDRLIQQDHPDWRSHEETFTKLCALREDRVFVEGLCFFLVKSGESVSTRTIPASCVILADETGKHTETRREREAGVHLWS